VLAALALLFPHLLESQVTIVHLVQSHLTVVVVAVMTALALHLPQVVQAAAVRAAQTQLARLVIHPLLLLHREITVVTEQAQKVAAVVAVLAQLEVIQLFQEAAVALLDQEARD
jgi:branched-subunit amino acid transport protein